MPAFIVDIANRLRGVAFLSGNEVDACIGQGTEPLVVSAGTIHGHNGAFWQPKAFGDSDLMLFTISQSRAT